MNGRRQKRHSQRSGKKTKEFEGVGKSDQTVLNTLEKLRMND